MYALARTHAHTHTHARARDAVLIISICYDLPPLATNRAFSATNRCAGHCFVTHSPAYTSCPITGNGAKHMPITSNETAIVPAVLATANVITPSVAPASPFSANANTDTARKAAAKRSLATKTVAKRTVAKAKQPRNVTVTPAKPAKPAATDRSTIIASGRKLASSVYNGLSLAVRGSTKLYSASDYASRHANPVQRTSLAKLTPRDESHLAVMLAQRASGFDPAACNIDLGGFSRLCSVGFIKRGDKAGTYALTPAGAAHARLSGKRVAA